MPDHVTILDIVAAAIMLVSIFGAVRKGLVSELVFLTSVVAGLILAFLFYDRVAKVLVDLGAAETVASLAGFLLTFVVVVGGGRVVAVLARRTVNFLFLRWVDHLLGGVFGVLRGWLVVAILFLAMTAFPVTGSLVADSVSGEFFLASADIVVRFAPQEVRERFSQEYGRIYELWMKKTRQDHHTRGRE